MFALACLRTRAKPLAAAVFAVGYTFLAVGTAMGLDYNDVKNLKQNQVSEPIIINMLQQSGPIAATSTQIAELRGLGASESLISAMMSSAVTATPTATPAATPSEVITYVEPPEDPSPTVYSSDSSVIYVEPSTSTAADSSVVYVTPESDSTYYYVPDSGVVVSSPPTVVYESPTYVEVPTYVYPSYPRYYSGPSWGFSIGFGGGRRPHYGPGRPGGHRPPSYRPGRPGGPRPGGRPGGGRPGGRPGGGRPGGRPGRP